jgi:hypothetical protein
VGTREHLKAADDLARAGRLAEAIRVYVRVADEFRENGFGLKAIAVYKQVMALANRVGESATTEHSKVPEKLARVYDALGLTGDAAAVRETGWGAR